MSDDDAQEMPPLWGIDDRPEGIEFINCWFYDDSESLSDDAPPPDTRRERP